MNDSPLQTVNLSRTFGIVEALRGIDFQVARGEFVAVVGPSGCGKTTLLSLFSGYEQPTSGTVVRNGRVQWLGYDSGV
ncbi:MAG: ATP-binding cassette domain-containing protein, partial [Phycisphaerales bacterium]|nr:ATP-binding cassette domain-containing protein [Phycisphaerales bacterium]